MNYLYDAYTAESCKCLSKSRSYKMFMKFLRRRKLSPLHTHSKLGAWCPGMLSHSHDWWGLDALEHLLTFVGGLMPRRAYLRSYMLVGGLMPWSFCSIATRAYALEPFYAQLCWGLDALVGTTCMIKKLKLHSRVVKKSSCRDVEMLRCQVDELLMKWFMNDYDS
jgi:hypothetical protein